MVANTRFTFVRLCLPLVLGLAILPVTAVPAMDEQQRQAAEANQQHNRGPDKPRTRSEYEVRLEEAKVKFKQETKFRMAVESAASAQKREHSEFPSP